MLRTRSLLLIGSDQLFVSTVCGLHDRSFVPRIVDDHQKSMHKVIDMGYQYRYHIQDVDSMPRIKNCRVPLKCPESKLTVRDSWTPERAQFGQNDYIDLLGDGSVHPAQLQYHTPKWLRGFPGQHRANELIKLIHYRNLYRQQMQHHTPKRWHELTKRIKYLLKYHNYFKQDELGAERRLGLWDDEPDYYYKDKSRRSYEDLV